MWFNNIWTYLFIDSAWDPVDGFIRELLVLCRQNSVHSWSNPFSLLVCRYGYHVSKTSYVTCNDPPTIQRIFSRIRNFEGDGSYPKACSGVRIVHIRDVTTGYDSSRPDLRSVRAALLLPVLLPQNQTVLLSRLYNKLWSNETGCLETSN